MTKSNQSELRQRRAALHGMKDILDDPSKAADDFVNYVPEWKGKEGAVKATLAYYATLVYPGQRRLGEIDAERLAKLQDFYLAKGIIQRSSPVEELYSNEFIKCRGVFSFTSESGSWKIASLVFETRLPDQE